MKEKNANGEGSLRQRKDGRWEYRVKVPNRKTPLSFYSTDADGRAAKKAYRAWLKESGGEAVESVKTVEQWAKVWLKVKKAAVVYGTFANYEFYTNTYILPALGKLKMDAVRPYHIAELYAGVSHLSNSAKNSIRVCLNGIFQSGRKNRLCLSNPAEDETFARSPVKPPKVHTIDEVKAILAYAPTHKWGHYLTAALYTGMRAEELCGLMWSDVDLEAMTIRIRQTVTKAENSDPDAQLKPDKNGRQLRRRKFALTDTTKSKRERVVVLNEEGVAAFRAIPQTGLFVFHGEDGGFLTPPQFSSRYHAVLRDLNRTLPPEGQVAQLSPHKARHTYASFLLDGGASIRAVQDQLGHAKLSTTQLYTHVDVEARKNNIRKLAY